ncbi:cupin-like domain-containing protein [Psychrosphaera sp. B3R10]|uniref:cupin-like domain-containing protein n=1 Tax=unclassified Psychrosphaera TaxID=2641570 RepID=UPI001C08ABFE|nr:MULTISPECIES: cupin-like domain-containing protein [unclassified Psychrosphaera]MBU2883954.1 cupin-like domain-containing protein [Psychrosphaera sp. I2R16]MBU2990359.1 cupin-like domain-containing protein [Psychrosphaera sp. B3R10]
MQNITNKTNSIDVGTSGQIPEHILNSSEPVILRGLVNNWELYKAGQASNSQAIDYLKSADNGKPAIACIGRPEIQGRFFYNNDISKLDYQSQKMPISEVLDLIMATLNAPQTPSYYIASSFVDKHLPSLRENNDLDISKHINSGLMSKPEMKIWLGNATLAACHYDTSDNIACCVVGNRRFTLFPPEQIHNLYPGPLELNPGGPAISMVDFNEPDVDKYPRFKDAIAAGQIAELTPGDALYLPRMWWHQVEGLSKFNVLINYWWNNVPNYFGEAMNVLQHALLSIKDRPLTEKKAWQQVFDYYIFSESTHAGEHLPEQARGSLGKIDELQARKLRAQLLNKLNR